MPRRPTTPFKLSSDERALMDRLAAHMGGQSRAAVLRAAIAELARKLGVSGPEKTSRKSRKSA